MDVYRNESAYVLLGTGKFDAERMLGCRRFESRHRQEWRGTLHKNFRFILISKGCFAYSQAPVSRRRSVAVLQILDGSSFLCLSFRARFARPAISLRLLLILRVNLFLSFR
jgi:hypothetical protein